MSAEWLEEIFRESGIGKIGMSEMSEENEACRNPQTRMVEPLFRHSDNSDTKTTFGEKNFLNDKSEEKEPSKTEIEAARFNQAIKEGRKTEKARLEAMGTLCRDCSHWKDTDRTGLRLIGYCDLTEIELSAVTQCSRIPLPEDRVKW